MPTLKPCAASQDCCDYLWVSGCKAFGKRHHFLKLLSNTVSFCYTQSESAILIYMFPPSWTSLPPHPIRVPWVITGHWAELPLLHGSFPQFYTPWCIYVKPNLPVHPPLPALYSHICSLHLHFFSCPGTRRTEKGIIAFVFQKKKKKLHFIKTIKERSSCLLVYSNRQGHYAAKSEAGI